MEQTSKAPTQLKPAHEKALQDFDHLPDSANVRLPVVAALHGVSTVTVWRWSAAGRLPAPIKTGGVTAWNVGALRRAMSAGAATAA